MENLFWLRLKCFLYWDSFFCDLSSSYSIFSTIKFIKRSREKELWMGKYKHYFSFIKLLTSTNVPFCLSFFFNLILDCCLHLLEYIWGDDFIKICNFYLSTNSFENHKRLKVLNFQIFSRKKNTNKIYPKNIYKFFFTKKSFIINFWVLENPGDFFSKVRRSPDKPGEIPVSDCTFQKIFLFQPDSYFLAN